MSAEKEARNVNAMNDGGISANVLFIFALAFFGIVLLNFISIYSMVPRPITAQATTSEVRLCVGPPSSVWFITPGNWAILNGTILVQVSANNVYSIDTVKNVSVGANVSLGGQMEQQQYYFGTIYYDGDTLYTMDVNTTQVPDANCRYSFFAQAESICEKKIAFVGKITINNIDEPPIWDSYKNNLTTNFSQFSSWTVIPDATIGKPGIGLINFSGKTLNFDNADLDSNVIITHNNISVLSGNEACLESSATLSFYNITLIAPKPMLNGDNCPESVCSYLNYSNDTYIMSVTNFGYGVPSYFSVAENLSPRLNIFDDTDFFERFIRQNVTFYANFTTASRLILNGSPYYCEVSFNEAGNYSQPVNISYNPNSTLYEHTTYFTKTGVHPWKVTCYSPNLEVPYVTEYDTFTITNRPPVQIVTIPNITWLENKQFSGMMLNDYFMDPDEQELSYDASPVPNIQVTISNSSLVTFIPDWFWFGNRTVTFYAHDPYGLIAESNEVLLTVIEVPIPPLREEGEGGISCYPIWNCTQWGPCLYSNISLRTCTDLKNCGINISKPAEYQSCYYIASCNDLIKNNGETGVDCGGPCKSCPSCRDLMQNEGEEGIDCGGPCLPCPSCHDGIQNGNETGIDCGGPCQSCAHVEMPAYIGKKSNIIFFAAAAIIWVVFVMAASKAVRSALSRLGRKAPHESEIESAEQKALLQLEALSRHLKNKSSAESAKELSFILREFFKGGFGLKYEFTSDELSRELKKLPLSTNIKIAALSFAKKLEELEFSGFRIKKSEISEMITQARRIIIELTRQIEEASKSGQENRAQNANLDVNARKDLQSQDSAGSAGSAVEEISRMLDEGLSMAKSGNYAAARAAYSKISAIYLKLDDSSKKNVKPSIIELYRMIGRLESSQRQKSKVTFDARKAGIAFLLIGIVFAMMFLPKSPFFSRSIPITGYEFVCTGSICFSPAPSDVTVNQSENVTVYVYVTNPSDENITFDTLAGNPLFSSIAKINNTEGKITFNPTNADVGAHVVTISVKNSDGLLQDQKQPTYTVVNVNDPPNITGWYPPEDNPIIPENNTLGFRFNYSASDPDIEYGDYLVSYWYLDGLLNATNQSSINYTTGFCDAGNHSISIIVNDSYGLTASHNWTANVTNVNRAPVLNKSMENFSWNEDSFINNALDIDNYFYDLDELQCNNSNKDNLTFLAELSSGGTPSVTVAIDPASRIVNFSAPANWCGNESLRFIANDSHDITYSNNFTLLVNCTSDLPILAPIGTQELRAEAPFLLYVDASDPDTPYGDYLNFSANDTSLFNITTINSTSAKAMINFTPTNDQLGIHSIRINVTDSTGLSDSEDVIFNITTNHAPVIDAVPNQSWNETDNFEMQINATDNDSDSFTISGYSSNSFPSFSISQSGLMNFTLQQADVGNHTITITATDSWGAQSSISFAFEVKNVNQPPVLADIPNRRAKINHAFNMIISASDPDVDYGDSLSFEINDTSLFSLQPYNDTAVLINFTPNESQIANYSFKVNVTDLSGASDSKDFNLTVDYNFIPQILVDSINATENDHFFFNISANTTDLDYDTLSFSYLLVNESSSTFPNFNMSSDGIMQFTLNKSDVGNHTLNITVSDGENQSSKLIPFKVLPVDNPPVLLPIGNLTAYEEHQFLLQLNATDIENDSLEFVYLLNGSFPSFNMSTSGLLNFTPNTSEIGNHTVNITVREVANHSLMDWEIVRIEVRHWNHPPNITSYSPNSTNLSIYENESINFSQTSTDADNDTLAYSWLIDSALNATTANWTYVPGYFAAGNHTITFIVNDSINTSSVFWNVTVININRPPYFGNYSEGYAEFLNSTNSTNTSLASGAVMLSSSNSSYSLSGQFISQIIDLKEDNTEYMHFGISNAYYYGTVPSGTSANILLRTSSNAASWGNWTSCSPECANLTSQRYVQYMLNLSTSNTSVSPNITGASILYYISNISLPENLNLWWILLPDFFKDPDYENLTYNYTMLSGQGFLNITLSPSGRVQLVPLAQGNAVILFNATDPYNAMQYSNTVNVTITRISVPVPVPESSGGSSTTIITKIPEEIPYSMNIIVPQPITIYRNDTIVVPVKIVNSGNVTLNNIKLFASAENKNLSITLTTNSIDKLEPGEEASTSVIIQSYQLFGSYEVLVSASVGTPKFNETNKIFISSLEKGSVDKNTVNTKIAYTRDLLSQNSVCLELNEFLAEVQKQIEGQQYDKANQMLNSIITDCTYLITQKQRIYEKPSRFSIVLSRNLIITLLALAVVAVLAISIILYSRKKFR